MKTYPEQLRGFACGLLVLALAGSGWAQSCSTASDMDDATRTAITNTAKRFFDMTVRGDSAGLQQNSIAGLASNFSGIEGAVRDNQPTLSGTQGTPRPPYLLKAEGTAPLERAEFLCGVFAAQGQTANSAVFVIPNLPPGTYAVDTVDVSTSKGPYTISYVLQQQGTEWKLGGLYVKSSQVSGHDGNWYADQARAYKAKGQTHNAWFYFLQARELLVPVPFMSTRTTDKLYDEAQAVKPADLNTDLSAGGKTYKITQVFPLLVGNDLDLVVKYQSADVSNTAQTFQDNMAVMKALVAKYPEYRDAFAGIVARAVEPSGKDYGSLLPMKDIK
jgi:hypothetical protein